MSSAVNCRFLRFVESTWSLKWTSLDQGSSALPFTPHRLAMVLLVFHFVILNLHLLCCWPEPAPKVGPHGGHETKSNQSAATNADRNSGMVRRLSIRTPSPTSEPRSIRIPDSFELLLSRRQSRSASAGSSTVQTICRPSIRSAASVSTKCSAR
jgi:hypothetical protein